MSRIVYCPAGGMDGILVTLAELESFAELIGCMLTTYIPLPEGNNVHTVHNCEDEAYRAARYWEIEDVGKHGWCCPICGKVTQWG